MYSIIFRYKVNHEYPLSKNVYNFQGSMSLFLWLCFFITYLTLPLNLYWKQFVSTCDIVIIDSRMPRHSCCEMRVMQCMTYFFCASLQVYTSFRSAQNHCPPDNVRPAGGYIRWGIDSPLILIYCSPPTEVGVISHLIYVRGLQTLFVPTQEGVAIRQHPHTFFI